MQQLKEQCKLQCTNLLQQKLQSTLGRITSLQNDLNAETKSSAGDKHETGRAMIQLEMEKESQKLSSFMAMKNTIDRIDPRSKSSVISLGSLVETDVANYFISVSMGVLQTENEIWYAISPQSPIGKILLGKSEGDRFVFQGREIQIKKLS